MFIANSTLLTKPFTSSPFDLVMLETSCPDCTRLNISPDREPQAPRNIGTSSGAASSAGGWLARSAASLRAPSLTEGARSSLAAFPDDLAANHRNRRIDLQYLIVRYRHDVGAEAGEVRDLALFDRAEIGFPE